jgi:hypothetical protein
MTAGHLRLQHLERRCPVRRKVHRPVTSRAFRDKGSRPGMLGGAMPRYISAHGCSQRSADGLARERTYPTLFGNGILTNRIGVAMIVSVRNETRRQRLWRKEKSSGGGRSRDACPGLEETTRTHRAFPIRSSDNEMVLIFAYYHPTHHSSKLTPQHERLTFTASYLRTLVYCGC